jgi:hypothetical protein
MNCSDLPNTGPVGCMQPNFEVKSSLFPMAVEINAKQMEKFLNSKQLRKQRGNKNRVELIDWQKVFIGVKIWYKGTWKEYKPQV